eukprot:1144209-Pelagomonas_calceolata.AAC.3
MAIRRLLTLPLPDVGNKSWKKSSQERVWCLQSKLRGCMSVKAKLVEGLQSVRGVYDLAHA